MIELSFSLITQAFFSALTAAAGFVSFVYVLVIYENYHFAVWAFICAIVSFTVTLLHSLYIKHKLDEWYDENSLDNFEIFSVLVVSISVVFSGYYLTNAIRKKEEFSVHSMYTPAIASLLSIFWSLILCISCRKYKRYVRMCEVPPNLQYTGYQSYQRF